MSGRTLVSLTESEWDNLDIHFGRFQLGLRTADEEIWLPQSEATQWSADDVNVVDVWFRRARDSLTDAFGVAEHPVRHVLLTGQHGTLSQYLSGAVWISYRRASGASWTDWATAWLAMTLLHELSHAWWVPVTSRYADSRARSLAEAIATVCQYAMLRLLFHENIAVEVWTYKASLGAAYLARDFKRHRKLVPAATSGLRAGYALSALLDDQGCLLNSLRELLNAMRAADPGTESLEALLQRTVGADLGGFLLAVLAEPRPPVVSVRVQPRSRAASEVKIVFNTQGAARRFAKRVRLSSLGRDDLNGIALSGRSVVLTFVATSDPRLLLGRLSPGLLLYRRTLQEASNSPLVAAIWRQAEHWADRSAPTSLRARIWRLALGLLGMVLLRDSPVGYRLVANALDGRLGPVARWASAAGLARDAW
jgi:hypothetical protein